MIESLGDSAPAQYRRGQIWQVNLEPVQGSEQRGVARPCVILSITPLNQRLQQVGVVPLSTSAKVLAPLVVATPSAGTESVALCHQARTVDKTRLSKLMGELSPEDLRAVEDGVRQVWGL